MDIVHRIGFSSSGCDEAEAMQRCIGMAMTHGSIITRFEISEQDPRWPEVERIVDKFGLPDTAEKRFTEAEVRSAKWSYAWQEYVWGYPMPKDDGGYKTLSFDSSRECPECGAGLTQVAPLRLKGELSWRGKAFMGIFWVLNICARPQVVQRMRDRGISGFETVPLLKYGSDEPLQTVMQLRFPREISGLIDSNLERDNPRCGHVKYIAPSREVFRFHADAFDGCPDFVQSTQWFGAMHLAVKSVFVSAAFANLYLDESWKGLRLEPVELV